jgi:hypothetical protein
MICPHCGKETDEVELPKCEATFFHGPGHQSRRKCRLRGPHTVHEVRYGHYNQLARWTGDTAFSGAFDEPPEFDED